MIRPIMRNVEFLSKKSEKAGKADIDVCRDLIDTLKAHEHECVGMAANMIGINKRIIIVQAGFVPMVMINPVIKGKSKESYETEEGCLSLIGQRKTKRYETVTVQYEDMDFKVQCRTFTGFTAQIIQHEIDHLNGIII